MRLARLKAKSVPYTKRSEYLQVIVTVKYFVALTKRRDLGAFRLSGSGRLRGLGTPARGTGAGPFGRGAGGLLDPSETLARRK